MRNLFIAVAFVSVTAVSSGAANSVANSGFETGSFSGWTLGGNQEGGPPIYDPSNGTYDGNQFYGVTPGNSVYPAHSGADYAYIGVDSTPLLLTQLISTTPGTAYTISFYLANDYSPSGNYTNSLVGFFGATPGIALTNVPGTLTGVSGETYTQYQFQSVATSSLTLLQFFVQNDAGYFSLDDVSVDVAIPEPGSILLFMTGAAGLLCFALRRRYPRI